MSSGSLISPWKGKKKKKKIEKKKELLQHEVNENVVFLGKTKPFRRKKHSLFTLLLGVSYMTKRSKFEFSSLLKKLNSILFDFCGLLAL